MLFSSSYHCHYHTFTIIQLWLNNYPDGLRIRPAGWLCSKSTPQGWTRVQVPPYLTEHNFKIPTLHSSQSTIMNLLWIWAWQNGACHTGVGGRSTSGRPLNSKRLKYCLRSTVSLTSSQNCCQDYKPSVKIHHHRHLPAEVTVEAGTITASWLQSLLCKNDLPVTQQCSGLTFLVFFSLISNMSLISLK